MAAPAMSWAAMAAKVKDKPLDEDHEVQVVKAPDMGVEKLRKMRESAPPTEVTRCEGSIGRKTLVLDTGALIKGGADLVSMAEEFCTIKEVFQEVRDRKTRDFVESFPYEVVIREPTKESMNAVIRMCKSTGDLGTLSSVDLRVLALAHTVAAEAKSITAPPTAESNGTKKRPVIHCEKQGTTKTANVPSLPGWGSWGGDQNDDDNDEEEEEEEEEKEQVEDEKDITEEEAKASKPQVLRATDDDAEDVEEANEEPADDDDEGWITPENIKKYKGENNGLFGAEGDTRTVGCMTTDFPMQNVLMHLGVLVVSVEGYRIKHLKKWVLRCHGCYCIVKDTTRQFCPDCGSGDTLKRVSYSLDDNGQEQIWINPHRKIQVRGTVYNIPKPRGGRAGTNKTYVIREDQLQNCGRQRNDDQKKSEKLAALLSEDWMFGQDVGVGPRAQHKKPVKSSYSRKNPNQGRRRKL